MLTRSKAGRELHETGDVRERAVAKVWNKIEKQHIRLCSLYKEMREIRRDVDRRRAKLSEGKVDEDERVRVVSGLLAEWSTMLADSLNVKQTAVRSVLAADADHKQMITLVSLWDVEPNLDWDRVDEIVDALS